MECNQMKMREALTNLVTYLNNEVKRTIKCKQCEYRGKTFRGEPCYWHVDCGIEDYDKKASYNAMYLMKRFKLQKALSAPPRQCDVGTAEEQMKRFDEFTSKYWPLGMSALQWAQTPYEERKGAGE